MKNPKLKIRRIAFILLWLQGIVAYAEEYPVSEIPDSLLVGADAVVRENRVYFRYDSETAGTMQCVLAVTVLNDKGADVGNFACYTDDFHELKRFWGTLYDGQGEKMREIKRSELFSTQFSSHLATDDWSHLYKCRMGIYPYTVRYEYEIKWKNGIISFPPFIPLFSWRTALQESCYYLDIPEKTDIKFKAVRMAADPVRRVEKGRLMLEWRVQGLKAIKPEPFSPSLTERIPRLYATPCSFVYAGIRGNMNDWDTFGKWQAELLEGRDVLPVSLKEKLTVLTKDAANDREKVKILYEYLGSITRYVSIQLGIGGLQPIPAEQVCKTGFGDCKGLTNLMKAMLNAVGIPSDYVVISTTNRRLFARFSNVGQMNHAILRVPLPGDTLWLECTDPSLPFGYTHQAIAGHDAIIISAGGGRFCTLPDYPDSLNREIHRAEIYLQPDGSAKAEVCRKAWLSQYEKLSALARLSPGEQVNHLNRQVRLPAATLSGLTIREVKEAVPYAVVNYRLEAGKYGNGSGKRLFIPVNVFRTPFGQRVEKERISPIVHDYGYMDCDTLIFRLPEGYDIETLPDPVSLDTEFGRFISDAVFKAGVVTVVQCLYFPKGYYDPDKQASFFSFFKQVSDAYQAKFVIRKE